MNEEGKTGMAEVVVFAMVVGCVLMVLVLSALLLIRTLASQECATLGYQDSITSLSLPIKRVCIARGATEDRYVPLVVARAFAR